MTDEKKKPETPKKPDWYESDFSDELCPTATIDLGWKYGKVHLEEATSAAMVELEDVQDRASRLHELVLNAKDPKHVNDLAAHRVRAMNRLNALTLATFVARTTSSELPGAGADAKAWAEALRKLSRRVVARLLDGVTLFSRDVKESEPEGNGSSGGAPTSSPALPAQMGKPPREEAEPEAVAASEPLSD